MKDYSIFCGIKELKGPLGTFRFEGGKVFEQRDQSFIHIGFVKSSKKYNNAALYREACNLLMLSGK